MMCCKMWFLIPTPLLCPPQILFTWEKSFLAHFLLISFFSFPLPLAFSTSAESCVVGSVGSGSCGLECCLGLSFVRYLKANVPFPLVLFPDACWEPHLSFCVFQSFFNDKFIGFPENLRPLFKNYYSRLETIPGTAGNEISFLRKDNIQCIIRVDLMIAHYKFFSLLPFPHFHLSGAFFDVLYLSFCLLCFIDLSAFKTVCLLLASNTSVWPKYLSSQIHLLVFNSSWPSNILW